MFSFQTETTTQYFWLKITSKPKKKKKMKLILQLFIKFICTTTFIVPSLGGRTGQRVKLTIYTVQKIHSLSGRAG